MTTHIAPTVSNRRELDTFVKSIYDQFSTTADGKTVNEYAATIRGAANSLHRFGSIIVQKSRPGTDGPHVVVMAS